MQDSFDLIELIKHFSQRRMTIILCAVLVGILALAVSLVLPKKYFADTSIIISENSESGSLSGFAAQAFAVAGLSRPGESQLPYPEILKSRSLLLNVIKSNNLREYYGFNADESSDLKLMREIRENLTVSPVRDNVLHLTYVDKNPEMAAKIANSFIEHLSEFLKSGTMNRAVNTKAFIEEQIDVVKADLSEAEEKLMNFSAEEEAAGIDEQITQMVRNAADIQALKTADEVSLAIVKDSISKERNLKKILSEKNLGINSEYTEYEDRWEKPGNLLAPSDLKNDDLTDLPDIYLSDTAISQLRTHLTDLKIQLLSEKITKTEKHPSVVKLNNEIFKIRNLFMDEMGSVLDSRLASLEFSRIELESQIDAYTQVLDNFESKWLELPDKSMMFLRYKRDVEALSQVYLMLKSMLAEAKIDAVRDEMYFEILDAAVPPDKPGKPKPVMNTLTGLVLGLILGMLWVYFSSVISIRKAGGTYET